MDARINLSGPVSALWKSVQLWEIRLADAENVTYCFPYGPVSVDGFLTSTIYLEPESDAGVFGTCYVYYDGRYFGAQCQRQKNLDCSSVATFTIPIAAGKPFYFGCYLDNKRDDGSYQSVKWGAEYRWTSLGDSPSPSPYYGYKYKVKVKMWDQKPPMQMASGPSRDVAPPN
ncbi:hypothetical protein [Streptomyces zagrosensis]|uniref:Uncharacterized protein n=1 Tax=Streptomyces zagrosensis TaxID=1042984 RepID=A0A7W9QE72_9ACTN|nr:hypothetical protein [Streptomyces zagrosensis]MBB5938635.1 hypothetical protein [Streptomyces zagrosensis]